MKKLIFFILSILVPFGLAKIASMICVHFNASDFVHGFSVGVILAASCGAFAFTKVMNKYIEYQQNQ